MRYSLASIPMNTGNVCRNMRTASLRDRCTSAASLLGRMGMTSDTDSSLARISAMTWSILSDRFRGWLAMIASTVTRQSTSSALGAGNSSRTSALCSTSIRNAHDIAHPWLKLCTTVGGEAMSVSGLMVAAAVHHNLGVMG